MDFFSNHGKVKTEFKTFLYFSLLSKHFFILLYMFLCDISCCGYGRVVIILGGKHGEDPNADTDGDRNRKLKRSYNKTSWMLQENKVNQNQVTMDKGGWQLGSCLKLKQSATKAKYKINEKQEEQKTETYPGETWGETRDDLRWEDSVVTQVNELRENKDYIQTNNEGMRNRWREE